MSELKDLRLKNKKINIHGNKEIAYEQVHVKPEVHVPVEHTCSVYSLPSDIKGMINRSIIFHVLNKMLTDLLGSLAMCWSSA